MDQFDTDVDFNDKLANVTFKKIGKFFLERDLKKTWVLIFLMKITEEYFSLLGRKTILELYNIAKLIFNCLATILI